MLWGSLFEQGSCSLNAAGVNRRRFLGGGGHPASTPSKTLPHQPSYFCFAARKAVRMCLRWSKWKSAAMGDCDTIPIMKTKLIAIVALCLLLPAQNLYGWNDHGHRVIVSIAFLQLPPERRLEIANRIKNHPRWESDFNSTNSGGFPKP